MQLPRPARAARAVIRLYAAHAQLSLYAWCVGPAVINAPTETFDRLNGAVGWALADLDLPARFQDPHEMATCPACGHCTHHLNGASIDDEDVIAYVFTCPACHTATGLPDVLPADSPLGQSLAGNLHPDFCIIDEETTTP